MSGAIISVLFASGCDRIAAWRDPLAGLTPIEAMNEQVRRGHWNEAWQYVKAVESQHSDDAKILTKLAKVAHESQHPTDAARLLIAACRAESFAEEKRNGQAFVAMIAVGRLYDGMNFLTEVVTKQPDQLESRRLLFDLLIGTENRHLAVPHGRYLIQKRRFDLELLMSLSNTERRTLDFAPLGEMVARNPSDKRPLIGAAKATFDKGLFVEAIKTSQQILASYPSDMPAQMLLGQALVSSGQYAELDSWSQALQGDYTSQDEYWLIVGDCALYRNETAHAARAFWEATRQDADRLQSWVRLRSVIPETKPSLNLSEETIAGIDQRIDRLSRLQEIKNRFAKNQSNSPAIAMELVSTLIDLGRLWEAEAWTAIALTFPADTAVDVPGKRLAIVAQLTLSTPWQLIDGHRELQLDLSRLELPKIAKAISDEAEIVDPTASENALPAITTSFSIQNEATERGLRFFGQTGEQVTGPGVPFYQTLGCGGGAVDYDLDGWTDLYLIAAGGTPPARDSEPNGLFRNVVGSFIDVTVVTETGDRGFGQGVAVGDLNEDGFADLLVLNYGPNRLLINQGDGTFSDQTAGSRHQGGCHVLMTDGAVKFITDSIEAGNSSAPDVRNGGIGGSAPGSISPYGLWGALGTRASKEVINQEI